MPSALVGEIREKKKKEAGKKKKVGKKRVSLRTRKTRTKNK